MPTGLTGKQGGKLLASFLLSERNNPAFGLAFQNGVVAWLKREQSKYNLWPAQKLLWAETIKYFPKLEAGLTKAQAAKPPMPDFDFGMPSTSTAPEPDFSTSGAFFTKIAEEVMRCMARGLDGGSGPHLLRPEGAPKRAVWDGEGRKGVSGPI